jgi:hypothetical protein
MPGYRVEVWQMHSYYIEVEADDKKGAEEEAHRILQEMSPEDYGCEYVDQWLDVMEVEEKT